MPENKPPIRLKETLARIPYKWNEGSGGGGSPEKTFSGNRKAHGQALLGQLRSAEKKIEETNFTEMGEDYLADKGFLLTFSVNPDLQQSLETFDSISLGVELLNIREVRGEDGKLGLFEASVFVAHGKLEYFVTRLTKYSEKEANQKFVDPIEKIGLATIETLWTSQRPVPPAGELVWWEAWIRRGKTERSREANLSAVRMECENLGFRLNEHELELPEHTILLLEAEKSNLAKAYGILNCVAELRAPTQAKLTNDDTLGVISRAALGCTPLRSPVESAPSVCVIDTGVNRAHPLLAPVCKEDECSSFDPDWTIADDHGHGTEMSGLVAYGDLHFAQTGEPVDGTHWVESVKLLSSGFQHKPENYGAVTVECMGRIESIVPLRSNRVFSMAVTAEDAEDFPDLCPDGLPTSWSAAIDSATASALDLEGERRIFIVSGGNVVNSDVNLYPQINHSAAFEDPAHSWNALTVGAVTHYGEGEVSGVAEFGGLSPFSKTSNGWIENGGADCPMKPEIVFEGGNLSKTDGLQRDELMPLSLNAFFTEEGPFCSSHGTSAATALAARMTAQIHAQLPDAWPETVRALLVNSSRWNSTMLEGVRLGNKGDVMKLVRTYGYGEPNLERATSGGASRATFYYEEVIQPFCKENGNLKTKEMLYFPVPIPRVVLEGLSDTRVKLHVTLSYFIEPNPGRRGLARSKFRYANCGLRFDLKTATESIDTFVGNRSGEVFEKLEMEKKGDRGNASSGWTVGTNNQGRGSLHHDIWEGPASDLASRDAIIVYPQNGWWRLRPKLERWDSQQRFSLVVTLEAEGEQIDIYSAVESEVANLAIPQRIQEIRSMFEVPLEVSV